MKHWKNLLVCLLAGVLALGVLTACSGLGSVNAGTDAEKAAELARQLGVAYAPELDSTAKAVAEWFVQEPDSLRVSGLAVCAAGRQRGGRAAEGRGRSQRNGRGLHRLQRHRLCRGSVPVSTGDQRDVPWNVPFLEAASLPSMLCVA